MNELLTTEEVSHILGVAVSTVKRMANRNELPAQYTSGKHRRFRRGDILAWLHNRSRSAASGPGAAPPASLAPVSGGYSRWQLENMRDEFKAALLNADEPAARELLARAFDAKLALPRLLDEVVARAFHELGRDWECGRVEIYQERQGCEISRRSLFALSEMILPPRPEAPLAIGGAVCGDQYQLPSTMVELVLRDLGWRARSLGANLPWATLDAALQAERPRLFWLSATHLENEDAFVRDYERLLDAHSPRVAFVLGGRSMRPDLRARLRFAACCDNMAQLEVFAKSLMTRG